MIFYVHGMYVKLHHFMCITCMSNDTILCTRVGMHVASFDDGSFAALNCFAQEMLDLWNDPIVIDGKGYFVVIGQILMDDKERAAQ